MSVLSKMNRLFGRRDLEVEAIAKTVQQQEDVARVLGPSVLGDMKDHDIQAFANPKDVSQLTEPASDETPEENVRQDSRVNPSLRPEGIAIANYLHELPPEVDAKLQS